MISEEFVQPSVNISRLKGEFGDGTGYGFAWFDGVGGDLDDWQLGTPLDLNARLPHKEELSSYHIVITTFERIKKTVRFGRNSTSALSALLEIHWLRLVVDEGHMINDENYGLTNVLSAISADCRWIMSGTSITGDEGAIDATEQQLSQVSAAAG